MINKKRKLSYDQRRRTEPKTGPGIIDYIRYDHNASFIF